MRTINTGVSCWSNMLSIVADTAHTGGSLANFLTNLFYIFNFMSCISFYFIFKGPHQEPLKQVCLVGGMYWPLLQLRTIQEYPLKKYLLNYSIFLILCLIYFFNIKRSIAKPLCQTFQIQNTLSSYSLSVFLALTIP